MSDQSTSPAPEATGTLGTFGGVFTPSVLTILGLVLFLRVSFVVGSVGLIRALVILAMSTTVSVLTSISLSVVATNMRVRGGGEYFLISRTLGIEFGGAVGVVLYLAISVSIAFYSIGFLQYLVMVLLVLALGSFFVGAVGDFSTEQLNDNLGYPQTSETGFWEAFAIFFPAVTGFSQGLAMSGDLRTPSRSITTGTFAAVGLSTIVYVAVIILLAGDTTAVMLVDNTTTIMGDLSVVQWTMIVGVLAATLSSALASALGGPRVLQRLGEDHVLPGIESFAEGAGPTNNPRRALGLSVIIAAVAIAAGDINAIAPVISMFFLATYAIINYASYYEITARGTAFRPRFRWYDHRAALAGTVACGMAVLAINPLAGIAAAAVLFALYTFLANRDTGERWVDSTGSHHYARAREHIRRLAKEPVGQRDWRPYAITFVPRSPDTRANLLTAASWLEGDAGFLTAVRMIVGTGPRVRRQARQIELDLTEEVESVVPGSYARALAVADPQAAVPVLVQGHGIGSLRPNMTIFGVNDLQGSDEDRETYGAMLRSCVRHGTNVAIVNTRTDAWDRFLATPRRERTIAVWWSDDQVGQLLTLLAWLMQRHDHWSRSKIIVYIPAGDGEEGEPVRVAEVINRARIDAEVVAVDPTPAAYLDAMSGATFALAPLRVRRKVASGPYDTSLRMVVETLPMSALVLASETLELDAQPDEGQHADYAKALDDVESHEDWVRELDVQAGALLVAAEEARIRLDAETDPAACAAIEAEIEAADKQASVAYRKYIDARVRQFARQERAERLAPNRVDGELDPSIWRPAGNP